MFPDLKQEDVHSMLPVNSGFQTREEIEKTDRDMMATVTHQCNPFHERNWMSV